MALGAGWSPSAEGLPVQVPATRGINLLKAPHEDLHIRWSARVRDDGGEFLLSREPLGAPASVVARLRPRSDGRYEVVDKGAAGPLIYKLRYRGRGGQEYVLITIHLNLDRIDSSPGALTTGVAGSPAVLQTAALLPSPALSPRIGSHEGPPSPGGPSYWPPTPPP